MDSVKMSEVCRAACVAHWWEVRSTARVCRRGRFYCLRICVWWSRGRGSSFLSWKTSPVQCRLHTVTQRPLPRGAGSQGLLQGPSLPSTGLGFPHTPSVCPQPDVRFPSLETEHEPGVFSAMWTRSQQNVFIRGSVDQEVKITILCRYLYKYFKM